MARYFLYVIPVPISVEQYGRSQTYVIAKGSSDRSHGSITTLKNEPYTKDIEVIEGDIKKITQENGIFTYKHFHLEKIVPKNVRWLIPKPCLKLYESCYNAFPHVMTSYYNEGAPKRFHMAVDTYVKPFSLDNIKISEIPKTLFKLDGLPIKNPKNPPKQDIMIIDISSSIHLANKKEKKERLKKEKMEKQQAKLIEKQKTKLEKAGESALVQPDTVEEAIGDEKKVIVENSNEILELNEGDEELDEVIPKNSNDSYNENGNSDDDPDDVIDAEVSVDKGPFVDICEKWYENMDYMKRFKNPNQECCIVYKLLEVNTIIPGQGLIEDFIGRKLQ